uniref:Uncharacterized protein n=1 Tax=Romanomermis culicivorax TaxID=13658 RepID=A0A915KPQ6_ROMCU
MVPKNTLVLLQSEALKMPKIFGASRRFNQYHISYLYMGPERERFFFEQCIRVSLQQTLQAIQPIDESEGPKVQAPACSQQALENPLGDPIRIFFKVVEPVEEILVIFGRISASFFIICAQIFHEFGLSFVHGIEIFLSKFHMDGPQITPIAPFNHMSGSDNIVFAAFS